MKLSRLLPLLLVAFTLFLSACGESEEEKQLKKISADQKAFVGKTANDVKDLSAALTQLKSENDKARNAAREMDDHLRDSQRAIGEIEARLGQVNSSMNEANAKIAREAAALEEKQKHAGNWVWYVLGILVLLVIAGFIFFIVKSNRGSDFEDDDEDFSDYDAQDDDLGFGDDDLEDDLNSPAGPTSPTGPSTPETK